MEDIENSTKLQFIFNLVEMELSDFEDEQRHSVIVPINYYKAFSPFPVSRATKLATFLVCINPYGLFCKPQYIVQRSSVYSEMYDHLSSESFQIVHAECRVKNYDAFSY